ncbi:hypothetical protein K1T71_004165 [Dendrolimus kikuchii]|uniref:Uncharacterized protein n=1 Tax=Dendrolimus kikuchii TaxID=765133 RepID=A0ACC1DA26_9NEOP|nr:hypothetical protein K1T71_004165 [Dendrolimus kikuchii]
MSFTDSMFLFEIMVESIKSTVDSKNFYIRSQFADVFTLILKNPNDFESDLSKKPKKSKTKKKKIKHVKVEKLKVKAGQSVLFATNIEALLLNMTRYPMEVSLWSKIHPDCLIASTHIPWSPVYIDYLTKVYKKSNPPPARATGEYNIFDEYTSRRMAVIKLNIKLTHLKDKITTEFNTLSEDNSQTFVYTGFNSKQTTVLSTIKENATNIAEDTGIIKTIYGKGKRKFKETVNVKPKYKEDKLLSKRLTKSDSNNKTDEIKVTQNFEKPSFGFIVKSDTDIDKRKKINVIQSNSWSSVTQNQFNVLNYIFDDSTGTYGNQVYCVNYFMVEKDFNKPSASSKSSSQANLSEKSEDLQGKYRFRICDPKCPSKKETDNTCSQSVCSLDLPEEAAHLISITKCEQIDCDNKKDREPTNKADERILIDLSQRKCCNITEQVEVVGGVKGNMKFEGEPCLCTCECTFGFTKKTTYCGVCGGYEKIGEELTKVPKIDLPFPCPIYHKLVDKNKLKTWSTSGSESKKRAEDSQKSIKGSKSAQSDKRSVADKSIESDKDNKKSKKKKDDRFKFNYGYQAPQIGHSQCAMPCTGTLGAVPKNMGWLWTAENIPGMKFRPLWRPGATNKHVVRLLRMAKNPDEILSKKRKKDTGKKKKPLKRPLLVVEKKDGEYTVTMETMKNYSKPRALNQAPYEDKPVLTYTIGRTEEENRERKRKRERVQRRLEREQREFIQSAFRDMCKEICVKTYQQALGILPGAEEPECTCYPAHPDADRTNVDLSCSCSEDKSLSICSDTDLDEWVLEFTPPNAYFDPKYKGKKVLKTDNSSQYTYMDYRVKLLDRYGNPVPRFFKGPDGKQQCSDLGGFWGPERNWLEINSDGYIGPDGRWAPNAFIGPSGEQVEAEAGKFQIKNGEWLVVGIDGYIDSQSKWKYYPKPRSFKAQKKRVGSTDKKGGGDEKPGYKPSEATWSCFGDASPKQLSKMGITGHGQDKKILYSTLQEMLTQGEDVKLPQPTTIPKLAPTKKRRGGKGGLASFDAFDSRSYFLDRAKCKHPIPPEKGIVAVDARGHKTYFRLKDCKNKRPKERLQDLTKQGISLSSFHVPCLNSFINSETMRQEQQARIMALSAKSVKSKGVSTQAG